MGKWTDRLNARNPAPPCTLTAKTVKRGSAGAFGSFGSAPEGGCALSCGPTPSAPHADPATEADPAPAARAPGRLIARASVAPVMLARPRPAGAAPAALPAPAAPAWPKAADSRPYRLAPDAGDAAHAEPWRDGAIARFQARVAAFRRRGFTEQDADDLAERAHLLDVQAEGRALCLSCRHLAGTVATGWRCGNHKAANVGHDLPAELVTLAQDCVGFKTGS